MPLDTRHKSLAEVRQTIRGEIAREDQYLKSVQAKQSTLTKLEEAKAQASINAYRQTLVWLSDLEG